MISVRRSACCSVLCCVMNPYCMLGIICNLSFSSLSLLSMHLSASLEREFSKLIGLWLEGKVGFCFGLGNVITMACFHEDGKMDRERIELIRLRRVGRYSEGSFFKCLLVMRSGPGAFFGLSLEISVDNSSAVIGRMRWWWGVCEKLVYGRDNGEDYDLAGGYCWG